MSAYLFYGKAGSGKGTQALKLKEYLESLGRTVIYIETGSMIRNFMAPNTTLVERLTTDIMNAGQLMPVFFPVYMWSDALIKNYTGTEDIILDGVARRIEEGHALDSAFEFFQIKNRFVFHIHIADQTAIDRLQIRRHLPAEEAGGRADDADVTKIQNRLDWYQENVIPVIEFFQGNNKYIFVEINGEESVDGVFDQIEQVLK